MAVPQRRLSKSRSGMRRSHLALTAKSLVSCKRCSAKIQPHRVCSSCGFYKGKEVVKVKGY